MSTILPSKFVGEYLFSNDFVSETAEDQKQILLDLHYFVENMPITDVGIDMIEYFAFNALTMYDKFDDDMKKIFLLILHRVTSVNTKWVYNISMLNNLGLIIQTNDMQMLILALNIIRNVLNTVHYIAKHIVTPEFILKISQCMTNGNSTIATFATDIYALCIAESTHYNISAIDLNNMCVAAEL